MSGLLSAALKTSALSGDLNHNEKRGLRGGIRVFYFEIECLKRTLVLDARPVEHALLVQVDVARFEDEQEPEEHDQKLPAAGEELDRPGVEERHFQVKNEEKHGYHVVFDGVALVRRARDVGKAALVGGTLDEDVLHLARVQEPVGKEQYGRDANRHDDQDGHGERGVENFNIAHSDLKDSKKLFSVNPTICKVYLGT